MLPPAPRPACTRRANKSTPWALVRGVSFYLCRWPVRRCCDWAGIPTPATRIFLLNLYLLINTVWRFARPVSCTLSACGITPGSFAPEASGMLRSVTRRAPECVGWPFCDRHAVPAGLLGRKKGIGRSRAGTAAEMNVLTRVEGCVSEPMSMISKLLVQTSH